LSRTQRIVKNVSSNWAGYAVNAAVILALTPYVLSQLGIERYGIWVIINSFIGYYGMLDFGFRAGVSQFLIRSIAAEDYPQANSVISTALATLAILGVIILLLTIAGALIIPDVLDLQLETRREATLCILIVGTASAIQISLSPFAAVFVAAQRFDLSNLIGVSMRLL